MNTIPWYRSQVFTAGLTAFVVQIGTMFDGAFITELLDGKPGALGRALAAVLTGVVVAVRAVATAEPLALTQDQADTANAMKTSRQGGFIRPMALAMILGAAVIALPVLQGCQALGIQQPQTFAQRYAYALSQTTALRTAATQALTAKQISTADAQYVLKLTDESRTLLDTARTVAAEDPIQGQRQLQLAIAVLTQLQTYLNARASK